MSLSNDMMASPRDVGAEVQAEQSANTENARGAQQDNAVSNDNIISRTRSAIRNKVAEWRLRTITALPGFLVNNGSNLVALTHLVGEVFMFKANNMDLISPENKGKPWRYLIDPPINIIKSLGKSSKLNFKAKDLVKADFYKNTFKSFIDLEHATKLDSANGAKLINSWQSRSTFAGLMAMLMAAIVPERPDDPEEVEKRAVHWKRNPVSYAASRVKDAFLFIPYSLLSLVDKVLPGERKESEIPKINKREFSGFMLMMAGVFSFLSGFRNVSMINPALGKEAIGNLKYVKNTAHSIGGFITAIAGSRLLLALDNEQGWENWGSTQQWRLLFLPKSIMNRYNNNDPKAHWYTGGQGWLQSSNIVSILMGGAEKKPDGTIIDHDTIRKEAKLKAKDVVREQREKKSAGRNKLVSEAGLSNELQEVSQTPKNSVSGVTHLERAMPERVEQQQARGEVAKDGAMVVAANRR